MMTTASRPKLTLVTPANFDPKAAPSSSLPLSPTSDLTSLLSDNDLRKKYRAGRYAPGKNVASKLYWTTPLSATITFISQLCQPKSGTDVIISLASHIGVLDMMGWESVQSLRLTQQAYFSSINILAPSTIHLISALLGIQYTRDAGRRTIIIPEFLDDDLGRLSGITGIGKGMLASVAIMLTLSCQPPDKLNPRLLAQLEDQVRELQHWLSWKAKALKSAVNEFEEYDRNRVGLSTEESFEG